MRAVGLLRKLKLARGPGFRLAAFTWQLLGQPEQYAHAHCAWVHER